MRKCLAGILLALLSFTSVVQAQTLAPGNWNNACETPWGSILEGGQNVTAYQASSPACSACVSESRTCAGNELSGTYAFQSCTSGGTSGFTLKATYDTPYNAYALWGDGTRVYVPDDSGLFALTFNGTAWTLNGSNSAPAYDIWGDGTYIYSTYTATYPLPDEGSGSDGYLNAHSFNGTAWTDLASLYIGYSAQGIWGDGTYIYVGADSLLAYTFNGTAFTLRGSYFDYAYDIWGDGTYIYTASGDTGVRAYTFNGTTWTLRGTYNTTGQAFGVWGDGTYIYVADYASGVHALSFNGTTWTLRATYNTTGDARGVWGDGTNIYVADSASGVHALSFNGTAWTLRATFNTPDTALDVRGYGAYLYVADLSSGVHAFTYCP